MEKKTTILGDIYCGNCGEIIKMDSEICPYCGVRNLYSMTSFKSNSKNYNYDILLPILYFSGLICFLLARFSSNIMLIVFANMILITIFIVSIIVVYRDANHLGASNSEKWIIVISILLLWIFIMPIYILKRKSL